MKTDTDYMPPEEGPEPTHDEVIHTIRDALWMLGHQGPHDDEATYCVPAKHFLPKIRQALALLKETHKEMLDALPSDLKSKLKQASRQSGNPLSDLAQAEYPEIRRFCKVQIALFATEYTLKVLEEEGRPPEAPIQFAKHR